MFRVAQKLKAVKDVMKTFNRSSGHVSELVVSLQDKLCSIQQEVHDNPHDSTIH